MLTPSGSSPMERPAVCSLRNRHAILVGVCSPTCMASASTTVQGLLEGVIDPRPVGSDGVNGMSWGGGIILSHKFLTQIKGCWVLKAFK